MADTEVIWRGLTLGGDGPYIVSSITGWDDAPDTTDMSIARVRANGDHVGDLYSQARIVTVTGKIADVADRDRLAQALRRITTIRSDLYDLTIDTLGQALTAQARVLRRALTVADGYAAGEVPFSVQFRCPDPLRYAAPLTASTGLPVAGGGLAFPLFSSGSLDWGTPSTQGQITLVNDGDADASIVFDVNGGSSSGLPNGFEISAAGQRITYPTPVPAGQVITIDTAAGTVLAESTSDRRGDLINADWMQVPAADPETGEPGTLTVQFTSLGGTPALPTAETRRNLATDPRATAPVPSATAAGWSTSRWFGSGGAGTHTWVSGAADGPGGTGITTYLRKTWTAAPTGNGDTGFANTVGADNGTETTGLPVSGGTTYTISSYLRPSSGKDGGNIHVWWHDAAGRFLSEDGGAGVTLPAGAWTRLTATLTAPAGAAFMQIVSDVDSGAGWAAGDTLDGTGLLIEATGTIGGYFDGSTAGSGSPSQPGSVLYAWTGTPNASASVAQVVQPGPQLLTSTWKPANS